MVTSRMPETVAVEKRVGLHSTVFAHSCIASMGLISSRSSNILEIGGELRKLG
jgi:hypothetical protein